MPSPAGLHPPIAAPLPDVETERLLLRRFREDDLDALAAVFAQREVWEFPYGRGLTRAETERFLVEQIAAWESCGFGLWLVVERASGRSVGYAGSSVPTFLPEILPAVEVGWRLEPGVWGRGYASEAARAALAQAFTTLGLGEVCSLPQDGNPRSSRVCERIGMRFEREVLLPASSRRGAVGALLYRIRRKEWEASREAAGGAPPAGRALR